MKWEIKLYNLVGSSRPQLESEWNKKQQQIHYEAYHARHYAYFPCLFAYLPCLFACSNYEMDTYEIDTISLPDL